MFHPVERKVITLFEKSLPVSSDELLIWASRSPHKMQQMYEQLWASVNEETSLFINGMADTPLEQRTKEIRFRQRLLGSIELVPADVQPNDICSLWLTVTISLHDGLNQKKTLDLQKKTVFVPQNTFILHFFLPLFPILFFYSFPLSVNIRLNCTACSSSF